MYLLKKQFGYNDEILAKIINMVIPPFYCEGCSLILDCVSELYDEVS